MLGGALLWYEMEGWEKKVGYISLAFSGKN